MKKSETGKPEERIGEPGERIGESKESRERPGELEERIKAGYRLGYGEAVALMHETPAEELYALADRLRRHFHGNEVDTCSIINARSGRCSEDCKWCSQSKFHSTQIDVYPLVDVQTALKEALHNASKGVGRFSLVTSGRTLSDGETDRICAIFREIGRQSGISLCASLGLLNREQMRRLRESGVERYHCNLETAPSHFPTLCSTHTQEEKLRSIGWAREAGLKICSGGIIGMGESAEQRVELAVTLQKLGVVSIPVNILNPIRGTALENAAPLSDGEILTAIAMMRIVNPDAHIRLAGGRTRIKHIEGKVLACGVSAAIVGDMLTTTGSDIDSDKALFRAHGLEWHGINGTN